MPPEKGRAGQTSRYAASGRQRVPTQDQRSESDVGYRYLVFSDGRLGLLLHGHRDGRYSRSILAWKQQWDVTSGSGNQMVRLAIAAAGMTEVPVADQTRLLSDNGSGYVSRAF